MSVVRCFSRLTLVSILLTLSLLVPALAFAGSALQFVPAPPCRVADTRNPVGPFGGPSIPGGTSREFVIPAGACNIPGTAAAYSLNVTVVPHGSLGFLTIWPSGQSQPVVSTLNSFDGRIKANAVVVGAGGDEGVSVYVSDTADVVLDINGYFTSGNNSALAFYTLTPCRVLDTRNPDAPLGGPYLKGNVARSFPLPMSSCKIPGAAEAYSLNVTAVPRGPLYFLSVWPTGQSWPGISTLNAPTGTAVANGAIVPIGTGGAIQALASNDTDMLVDINGYFAPVGSGGLSLFSTQPCRVLDTRNGIGNFKGELTVNVVGSPCGIPSAAQAYVLNATVVPPGSLGYLSLWPDGQNQPLVSTLNAYDGAVTSNMAIVPATNGKIDAYASDLTPLILDNSSYFAPTSNSNYSAPTYFLVGNWAGTATLNDGQTEEMYMIGASISQGQNSFTATLMVQSQDGVEVFTVNGQINGNMVTLKSVEGDVDATGTISPNGLQVSGGTSDYTATGMMTWDGMNTLTATGLDDTDVWNGTVTTDGQHLTGSGTTPSSGGTVSWSMTRQ